VSVGVAQEQADDAAPALRGVGARDGAARRLDPFAHRQLGLAEQRLRGLARRRGGQIDEGDQPREVLERRHEVAAAEELRVLGLGLAQEDPQREEEALAALRGARAQREGAQEEARTEHGDVAGPQRDVLPRLDGDVVDEGAVGRVEVADRQAGSSARPDLGMVARDAVGLDEDLAIGAAAEADDAVAGHDDALGLEGLEVDDEQGGLEVEPAEGVEFEGVADDAEGAFAGARGAGGVHVAGLDVAAAEICSSALPTLMTIRPIPGRLPRGPRCAQRARRVYGASIRVGRFHRRQARRT